MFDIRLFGITTVRSATTEVVGSQLGGVKPRQVLEVLALAGAAPVTKDLLVQVLWGDTAPASPVATVESYVSVLRRSMGVGKGTTSPIVTTSAGYHLDRGRVSVDVLRCRSLLARAATASDAQALALTRKALRYCEEPLLASETRAGWADQTRDEFRQQLATACGRASRAALATGDHDQAVLLATRATTLEPYDEALTRDLMQRPVQRWTTGCRPQHLPRPAAPPRRGARCRARPRRPAPSTCRCSPTDARTGSEEHAHPCGGAWPGRAAARLARPDAGSRRRLREQALAQVTGHALGLH